MNAFRGAWYSVVDVVEAIVVPPLHLSFFGEFSVSMFSAVIARRFSMYRARV